MQYKYNDHLISLCLMNKTYIVTLLILVLTSCAYKRLTKQGAQYEEAGLLEHAIKSYTTALDKKETYASARIGLMRAATLYATEIKTDIEESYQALNDNQVVDNYLKLENLKKQCKSYDVNIEISERTTGQFDESKNRYLIQHYAQGKKLVDNENFTAALEHFSLVESISPHYADVEELSQYCKAEPQYRQGQLHMQLKQFRTAYRAFGKALSADPNFKDAQELMQEALHAGMLTVTFLPIYITYPYYEPYVDAIIANVSQSVEKANNPFLQMREQTQALALQELQKQALAANQEIDVTQTIPIRAALSCRLTKLTYNRSKLTKSIKKGVVKQNVTKDSVVYHKVRYTEYEQSANASLSFSYSLLSVESGFNLFSGIATPSTSDKVKYITFDGDKKNLYPGSWEKANTPFNPKTDQIYDDFISRNRVRVMVYSKRELHTEAEMKNTLVKQASKELSDKLINYNPEQ